jgi:uncharacterized cupin superfamily protein
MYATAVRALITLEQDAHWRRATIGASLKLRQAIEKGVPPMPAVEVKSFDNPDETRPFEGKGQAQVVNVAGRVIGCGTFEPGWKWSENVKPIAGTDSCEVSHLGYCVSGRMRVHMDDGTVGEVGPGEVCAIPPGHDAETVGEEPCVFVDFGEFGDYAKRA